MIHSKEEAHTLNKEMVRKYCLLVKNHSMKGYSPLIRKILTRINSDLTADLSLNTQAELLKPLRNISRKHRRSTASR